MRSRLRSKSPCRRLPWRRRSVPHRFRRFLQRNRQRHRHHCHRSIRRDQRPPIPSPPHCRSDRPHCFPHFRCFRTHLRCRPDRRRHFRLRRYLTRRSRRSSRPLRRSFPRLHQRRLRQLPRLLRHPSLERRRLPFRRYHYPALLRYRARRSDQGSATIPSCIARELPQRPEGISASETGNAWQIPSQKGPCWKVAMARRDGSCFSCLVGRSSRTPLETRSGTIVEQIPRQHRQRENGPTQVVISTSRQQLTCGDACVAILEERDVLSVVHRANRCRP